MNSILSSQSQTNTVIRITEKLDKHKSTSTMSELDRINTIEKLDELKSASTTIKCKTDIVKVCNRVGRGRERER